MKKRKWGREDLSILKGQMAQYKADCPDWKGRKRDDRARKYMEAIAKDTMRGIFSVKAKWAGFMPRYTTKKTASRMILRGSRKYTPEGLKALQENGRQKNILLRENLKAFGLSDVQIEAAFSGKVWRLEPEQVSKIERTVAVEGHAMFRFERLESGKIAMLDWTDEDDADMQVQEQRARELAGA